MPFCRFCFDNNINGPHDHYIRETKDSNSRIVCPLLLNTKCLNCNKKGHTTKYCVVKIPFKTKFTEIDDEGFTVINNFKSKKKEDNSFVVKESKNVFSMLCEESEEENEDPKEFPFFEKRPEGMSWADWEEA